MFTTTLQSLWSSLSNIGLDDNDQTASFFRRRTRLINQSCGVYLLLMLSTGIGILLTGAITNGLMTLLMASFGLLNLVVHYFRRFRLVPFAMLTNFLLIQLSLAIFLGADSYAELCMIVMPCFGLLFFNSRRLLIFSVGMALFGYFACELIYFYLDPLLVVTNFGISSKFLTSSILCTLSATMIYFFKNELTLALSKVESQNEKLVDFSNAIDAKHRELEVIANTIPACIAYISTDYRYLFNNQNYERWFGLTPEELKGRPIKERLSTEDFAREKIRFDKVVATKKTIVFEQHSPNFTNPNIEYLRVTLIPDIAPNNEEVKGVYIFAEDITALKRMTIAMRETNEELSVEIDRRKQTEVLLLEANEELKQFSGIASHDLKEPLRTISGFSSLLRRGLDDNSTNKEYLDFIESAAKRMTILIEDLINYSKVGKNKYHPKIIDLNDVLLTVKHNLHHKIQTNKAQIIHQKMPIVWGMSTPLMQLFQNIIANAIKFQTPDTTPIIQLKSTPEGDFQHLTISDNGIGMAAEYHEAIFSPFTRLHTREEYEGSGLGLATCKKIVTRLKGKIWVESTIGVGTTFHILLPIQSQEVSDTKAVKAILTPVN